MTHRRSFILAAALMACLFFPWGIGGLHAQVTVIDSGYCGGEGDGTNLTWTLASDSVLTISGSGTMADFTSGISTYPPPWSRYNLQIRTIIIGDSVTNIGNYAFTTLWVVSAIIGKNVKTIGTGAFESCGGITSVNIPNGVTSIGRFAFSLCGLTSIIIPNSVTIIGDRAFATCSNLASVTIGENVASIENRTFQSCYSMNLIVLPDKLLSIGERAFDDCINLTYVGIGNGIYYILPEAFYDCYSLDSVTIRAVNPPILFGNSVFGNVDTTIPVYVKCESVPAYRADRGWSYFSNYIGLDPPSTPTLTVEQQNNAMVITWQNTGAPLYEIYRNNKILATISTTTYTDNNLTYGTTYCYQIKAIEENCESLLSDTVCEMFDDVGIAEVTKLQGYEVINYEVYDMLGRCVASPNPSQTSAPLSFQGGEYSPFEGGRGMSGKAPSLLERVGGEAIIDISHLPAGIYVIKISTDKGIITKKIVKN